MKRRPTPLRSGILSDGLQRRHFHPVGPAAKKRAKAAAERRRQLIDWLRKKCRHSAEALRLAETMQACGPGHRCLSGACPECSQATQNLIVQLLKAFVATKPSDEKIAIISIAQARSAVSLGQLHQFSVENFVRRLKYGLAKAGAEWVIGGIDFSQNEHAARRYEPFWLPHFFGFTATSDLKGLRQRLKQAFPKSDAIPRPVSVKAWDGRQKAFRYAFKSTFVRRVGLDDAKRFDPNAGKPRSCRNTRKQRLRSAERLELLLHLDAIGSDARLVMFKAQLRRMRDGPTITEVPGKLRKLASEQYPESTPETTLPRPKNGPKRAIDSKK